MKREEAIKLLKRHSTSLNSYRGVLKHSKAVERYAVWLARRVKRYHKVDIDFISAAALLHDIGRFKCPPGKWTFKHGVVGAGILRKEKLPEKYARVCETHLGAGITKSDVKQEHLSIPSKDYVPKTIAEKIISYADLRFKEDKLQPIAKPIKRFASQLGPKYGLRVFKLHKEIQKLYKPRKKIKHQSR